MYIITHYKVHNGKKTTVKLVKPVKCKTFQEVEKYEQKLQNYEQKAHKKPIEVFVDYTDKGKQNLDSENYGKHDCKLNKWM